jgi:hypothetical protein
VSARSGAEAPSVSIVMPFLNACALTTDVVTLYRQHPVSVSSSASRGEHRRLRAAALDWADGYLRSQPDAGRRAVRWLRRARFLDAKPRVARLHRVALRLSRIAKGYRPRLREKLLDDLARQVANLSSVPVRSERP